MKKSEENAKDMEKQEQVIGQDENAGKKEEASPGKLAIAGAKGAKVAVNVISRTASGGKAVATGVSQGAKELAIKMQNDAYIRKKKKYNPLFPEEYASADFFLPNIICIVDDAVRRDIDVCQGAIGWREKKGGSEVLCLYDEFVPDSGLTFVPAPMCDEIYYVDAHDRKRFIKLDCIFQQAHDEKLAELEYIAYSLGAKRCVVEFDEVQTQHQKKKRDLKTGENAGGVSAKENYSSEMHNDNAEHRYSRSEAVFKGNANVTRPQLKWFAHDGNILNLIEYRCDKGNEITAKTLILSGSASATMGRKAACSIDAAAAGYKVAQSCSMEESSIKESQTRITYILEF